MSSTEVLAVTPEQTQYAYRSAHKNKNTSHLEVPGFLIPSHLCLLLLHLVSVKGLGVAHLLPCPL